MFDRRAVLMGLLAFGMWPGFALGQQGDHDRIAPINDVWKGGMPGDPTTPYNLYIDTGNLRITPQAVDVIIGDANARRQVNANPNPDSGIVLGGNVTHMGGMALYRVRGGFVNGGGQGQVAGNGSGGGGGGWKADYNNGVNIILQVNTLGADDDVVGLTADNTANSSVLTVSLGMISPATCRETFTITLRLADSSIGNLDMNRTEVEIGAVQGGFVESAEVDLSGTTYGAATIEGKCVGQEDASAELAVIDIDCDMFSGRCDLLEMNAYIIACNPETPEAGAYAGLICRQGQDDWWEMEAEQVFAFTHRVAGRFNIRGRATFGGKDLYSEDTALEVRFPSISTIMGDENVVAVADNAWQETLDATVDGSRREQGFWIVLDTLLEEYQTAGECVGTPVGNDEGASLDTWTPKPADSDDDPIPILSATYVVGWFHTHTPTTFRTVGRPSGPSAADYGVSSGADVPGIVYDYTATPVPAGHLLDSAAGMQSITPPDRRPTP